MLSWGCRVGAVTPTIQVVWWLPESWCWSEALCYCAEAAFCTCSCQAKRVGNDSSFFQHVDIHVWVDCHSSLHHIKENHSFTVPEHCDHHLSSWWRTTRSCALPSSPSLFLPSDLHCSCGLQHFHKHCWVTYWGCSLFLSLQQGTLLQHILTAITGRLHFEELQQRWHVVGTFANLYIEWGKFKCVVPAITAS